MSRNPRAALKKPPTISLISLRYCTSGMTTAEISDYADFYDTTLRSREDLAPGARIFLHVFKDPANVNLCETFHLVASHDSDSTSIRVGRTVLPALFKLRRAALARIATEHPGE